MTARAEIVAEALSWVGTPYRHQHSTKGAGCDCLGLVRGVYRNTIGPEPERPPNYTPSWGESSRRDVLLIAANRHLVKTEQYQVGDVLIFRMARGMIAKHCGIVVSDTHMVHAYQGAEVVAESALVPYWISRIAGAYSYPGVT